MNRVSRRHAASVLVCFALVAAACGSSSKPSGSTSSSTAKLSGALNVFAAASLTEAFNDEKKVLGASDPGLSLTYNFAGSQALVTQIKSGAPADVFASADQKNMQKLVDAGLVETPKTFARNTVIRRTSTDEYPCAGAGRSHDMPVLRCRLRRRGDARWRRWSSHCR